jgi:pyruvate carboxylase
MALFLFSRGVKAADVVNLEPGSMPYPESVIDMLTGGLGWPDGGWPIALSKAVLGLEKHKLARTRYAAALRNAKKKDKRSKAAREKAIARGMAELRRDLAAKLKTEPTDDELFSHLMYPQVHETYRKHRRQYGDVSVLPSSTFFYGLQPGEEISVEIEQGKTLIIQLISIGEADKDGKCIVSYELNGIARDVVITDKSVTASTKSRAKADTADSSQVGAPIPGLIASLAATVGGKVKKGEKILLMEAMKMQTTVYAPCDGVVSEVTVEVGDTVESKDLLVRIKPSK